MGRRSNDVELPTITEDFKYNLDLSHEDNLPRIAVPLDNGKTKKVLVTQVAAEILRFVKRALDKNSRQGEIKDIVLTVPAYFNNAQREETIIAAESVGFNVLRLIAGPTAAALAHINALDLMDVKSTVSRTLGIFDYGGGTFDISIVRLTGMVVQVLATDGRTTLVGEKFTASLAALAYEDFKVIISCSHALFWVLNTILIVSSFGLIHSESTQVHQNRRRKNSPSCIPCAKRRSKPWPKTINRKFSCTVSLATSPCNSKS